MVYKWLDIIHRLHAGSCLLCGGHCPPRDGLDLCPACRDALPRNHHPCPACGQPQVDDRLCGHCQRQAPPFARTLAPWLYAPPLDGLVLRLKGNTAPAPARTLGRLLAAHIAPRPEPLPQLLIPMPLHPRRLRERGFNQATLLARQLGGALDLPWHPGLLAKVRESADQRGLDRRARRRNLHGCFACRPLPPHSHVALVDDVVTTGATAWEASRALRRAGAERVEIWALARTP